MLINKAKIVKDGVEEKISREVRYNGIDIVVGPGDKLDVRDFNILHKNVKEVERHIMQKFPGDFEQTETVESSKAKSEYEGEIDRLKKENKELKKIAEQHEKAASINASKATISADELNAKGKEVESLKGKIANLEQRIKDIEEDHAAQLAKISGGKKGK